MQYDSLVNEVFAVTAMIENMKFDVVDRVFGWKAYKNKMAVSDY